MTKKIKPTLGCVLALLVLAGFAADVAWADLQVIPFTARVMNGSGCPGANNGYAKMTNSAGTYNITPPANATGCTFTDASGFAAPYVSVATVIRKSDQLTWCGTNSVTFPVASNQQYSMTIYVKSTPPPPTNSQPIKLQANWQ